MRWKHRPISEVFVVGSEDNFFLINCFGSIYEVLVKEKIRYYRISTMYPSYTINTSVTDVFFVVFCVEHTLPMDSLVNSALFWATMCEIKPYKYRSRRFWTTSAIYFFIGHIFFQCILHSIVCLNTHQTHITDGLFGK